MRARLTDDELARVLEECLEAMDRGEVDLDALAGRYPSAKHEIRPLLEIAAGLQQRRALYPKPAALLRDLRKLLQKVSARR